MITEMNKEKTLRKTNLNLVRRQQEEKRTFNRTTFNYRRMSECSNIARSRTNLVMDKMSSAQEIKYQ